MSLQLLGLEKNPLGTDEDGPWNHRLLLAVSGEGISWQKLNSILADQASVPDVIVDREGYIRVYYVDFYNGGIVVAISRDLENWSYIRVKGISPEWVDPSVILLPNGRYRLYASYMPLDGKQNKIVSAISEDGIHFEIENGVRYESDETLTDPDVIYDNGKFVMYVQENIYQPENSRLIMLTSEDGLNFKYEGEVKIKGHVPCIIKYGDGYRIYLHKPDDFTIISYYSRDLESWEGFAEVLRGEENSLDKYGAVNPAVVQLPDGNYLMVYQTWIEEPAFMKSKLAEKVESEKEIEYVTPGKDVPFPDEGPWNNRILIAVSDDGIKWEKLYRIISDYASVPDVIVDEEGYVRVYYIDFANKGITLARSKDLSNWEYIRVEGIEHSWEDPSIVMLPDGRFRLYASLSEEGVQRKIVSAISRDGIHFKPEGVVYESDFKINDPDVIYSDGLWIMVLNVKKVKA